MLYRASLAAELHHLLQQLYASLRRGSQGIVWDPPAFVAYDSVAGQPTPWLHGPAGQAPAWAQGPAALS